MANWAERLVRVAAGGRPRPGVLGLLLGRLLLAPRGRHRALRAAAGLLWGALLGVLLLRLMLHGLGFDGHVGVALGAAIVLLLAVGNAVSVQVRAAPSCHTVLGYQWRGGSGTIWDLA